MVICRNKVYSGIQSIQGRPGSDRGAIALGVERLGSDDNSELLNSFVNRGFDAKAEGKLDLAVKYFSSAIDLNPSQDIRIMLAFDVFGLLMELGRYKEAEQFLAGFGRECYSGIPSYIRKEIQMNLKYIEAMGEMLAKANTPNLPHSMVPALIRITVEEKVNEWIGE